MRSWEAEETRERDVSRTAGVIVSPYRRTLTPSKYRHPLKHTDTGGWQAMDRLDMKTYEENDIWLNNAYSLSSLLLAQATRWNNEALEVDPAQINVTIGISPRPLAGPLCFFRLLVPYRIHGCDLFLIGVTVLLVKMLEAVDFGQRAVQFQYWRSFWLGGRGEGGEEEGYGFGVEVIDLWVDEHMVTSSVILIWTLLRLEL